MLSVPFARQVVQFFLRLHWEVKHKSQSGVSFCLADGLVSFFAVVVWFFTVPAT
jgi:hypothetical protein